MTSVSGKSICVTSADPAEPSVRVLIDELDAYQLSLYPAESNHLLDIETLRHPRMRFFAAVTGGQVLGIGGCWLHADYAEIKRVSVSPKARGLGLAKKLMDHIEAEALAAGMAWARLETGIRQPEAIGLYRKFGYVECGAFGDYPVDDPNSVFMEKNLAAAGPQPASLRDQPRTTR